MGNIARIWDNAVLQGVLNFRLVQFCDENTEENRLEQQNKVYFFLGAPHGAQSNTFGHKFFQILRLSGGIPTCRLFFLRKKRRFFLRKKGRFFRRFQKVKKKRLVSIGSIEKF